jgi:hypothetical protein
MTPMIWVTLKTLTSKINTQEYRRKGKKKKKKKGNRLGRPIPSNVTVSLAYHSHTQDTSSSHHIGFMSAHHKNSTQRARQSQTSIPTHRISIPYPLKFDRKTGKACSRIRPGSDQRHHHPSSSDGHKQCGGPRPPAAAGAAFGGEHRGREQAGQQTTQEWGGRRGTAFAGGLGEEKGGGQSSNTGSPRKPAPTRHDRSAH